MNSYSPRWERNLASKSSFEASWISRSRLASPLLQLAEPVEGGIDDRRDPFWISVPRAVEEGVHDPHPCDGRTKVRWGTKIPPTSLEAALSPVTTDTFPDR